MGHYLIQPGVASKFNVYVVMNATEEQAEYVRQQVKGKIKEVAYRDAIRAAGKPGTYLIANQPQ